VFAHIAFTFVFVTFGLSFFSMLCELDSICLCFVFFRCGGIFCSYILYLTVSDSSLPQNLLLGCTSGGVITWLQKDFEKLPYIM